MPLIPEKYQPSPEELALEDAMRTAGRMLVATRRALRKSNACLICSQITPNSGPFCTVCQLRYGQSRDGVTR
jgi:hypothetical protein